MNSLNLYSFSKRYYKILKCLKDLNELEKFSSQKLISNLLSYTFGNGVLSTIIKCIGIFLKDTTFLSLMNSTEINLWINLELEMIKIFQKNDIYYDIYINLIEFFIKNKKFIL